MVLSSRSFITVTKTQRSRPHEEMSVRQFTAPELAEFDGSKRPEIYLSVFGDVFNVTAGVDFYGPGKGYNVFAGNEVTRCLGKMQISKVEANCGWANLSEEHVKIARDWHSKFQVKYPIVGRFAPDAHFEVRGVAFEP